jgi:hypothetical protein
MLIQLLAINSTMENQNKNSGGEAGPKAGPLPSLQERHKEARERLLSAADPMHAFSPQKR